MGDRDMITVKDLQVHQDDRGSLFEAAHNYDIVSFGQVYVVSNPARGAVRAFHKHYKLFDYFIIVAGVAKFCFVDDRENGIDASNSTSPLPSSHHYHSTSSVTYSPKRPGPGGTKTLTVSGERPKLITVPPGVFHGWMSLVDNTILLSVGSELYDQKKPDEIRVSPIYFNQEFGGRNPWITEGR